jgi:hypothetical protein
MQSERESTDELNDGDVERFVRRRRWLRRKWRAERVGVESDHHRAEQQDSGHDGTPDARD